MRKLVFAILLSTSSICVADESVTISIAILEGDVVSGVGAVQFIDNVAINDSGDWIVECNTDFPDTDQDGVLVFNGSEFLREGVIGDIDAPTNAFIDIFDSVNINNNGNSGMNLFIDPLPTGEDSGIYLNESLLIQESDFSTAPELSANTPFIGFFDAKINNRDAIMIMASVDDPAIATTVDRAIVILDTVNGQQTVVAKEGDVLPMQTEVVDDFATGPHASAFNDNGDVLFIAELDGSTVSDNAVYLNQTLLAQEGFASPQAGRTYEFIADRALDVNNDGDYVFKANLSGDTTTDDVLIKNGEVFKQEGDPAPGGSTFVGFGASSGPVRIGDNGKVVWFGEWATGSGLFVDDDLVVQAGVTQINGQILESLSDIQDSFAISTDGNRIIFEGSLLGGISGAFIVELSGVLPGDVNQDGAVDLLDVTPFIDAIGGSFVAEADVNCDGVVDLLDVAPFIALLSGG